MFYREDHGGVTIYKSSLLRDVPHGFSTRIGGVSEICELASMNMGTGLGDDDRNVYENRRRFSAACGFENGIITGKQIHSPRIIYCDGGDVPPDTECDGFCTDAAGCAVGIKTADCVPILLSDKDGRRVAAVHAGWRGSAAGIASEAVGMLASLGADRDRIRAAIGMAICSECYRVGDDFDTLLYEKLTCSLVGKYADRLIDSCIFMRDDGKHCDLVRLNREILLLSGVRSENIDSAELCTCERKDEFFSHRRQGPARGVMLSAVMPTAVK